MNTRSSTKARFVVLLVLGIVVFSSAFGASMSHQAHVSTTALSSGKVQNITNNTANSTLSYKINNGNSSVLSPSLNTTWTSAGSSLAQKVSSLKIPEKAKMLPNFDTAPRKEGNAYLPSYTSGPAPMGVGSYGVKNVSGTLTPYNYTTSSFEGSLTVYNASELYLGIASPTSYGVQLNAVLNNVTLFGNRGYQYWTQNVAVYTGSNKTLTFVDNIWNFTSPNAVISGSEFYSYNGSVVPGVFYYKVGPVVSVTFPFTLDMYLNTSDVNGHNTVFFNYSITSGGNTHSASYDEVQFNSTSPGSVSNVKPANYEVSGNTLTGTGFIPMDAEMIIGGPGGGSTAVFQKINATMNLYYKGNSGTYSSVKSAYSSGSETGETSSGISESYSGTTAYLDSGPTFVNPLWNITSSQRFYSVSGTIGPSNAFVFVNNGSSFNNVTAQWSPVNTNGTLKLTLPSGNYSIEVLMSYHKPVFIHINLNHNMSIGAISLTYYPSAGLYTPLYAYNNAQLQNLSINGSGNSSDPFIIPGPLYYADQGITVPNGLNTVFSQFNDYLFPTFNGIMISGTTDYVLLDGFQTTNGNPVFSVQYPGIYLNVLNDYFQVTSGNYLNMVFYSSSHVMLNNSVVSGWFSAVTYTGLDAYNIPIVGSVLLWNTTNSLIEHNTIMSDGSGIFIYGQPSHNLKNVVWNNTFGNGNAIPSGAYFGGAPIGLTVAGSGNLVYNNVFNSIIPVVSIGGEYADIYTGGNATYTNQFNITKVTSTHITVFDGVSLSGSILGLSYQGGNYYYNYFGNGSQPYNGTGVGFAFNSESDFNGSISYTYDYSPLVKYGYTANVTAIGLPPGDATYFDINNAIYTVNSQSAVQIYLPNGTYFLLGFLLYNPSTEYAPTTVLGSVNLTDGYFAVSGIVPNITLAYSTMYNLTVSRTGLPQGTVWGFSVPGAGIGYTLINDSQSLYVLQGTYDIFPQAVAGYYAQPYTVSLQRATDVVISYSNLSSILNLTGYTVTFRETGLSSGTTWGIVIQGHLYETSNTSLTFIDVPAGTFNYSVSNVAGYRSISSGNFTVGLQNTTIYITYFRNSGPSILLYAGIGAVAGFVIGGAVVYTRFRRT